ncbi:aspartate/glutamate racemase family protein [Microbulbifer sp. 2205BS26-8]|uniref:aspartate/glutamate racemase family protein n=1 Tax=Microbulbifer sp. 2205BS26-8 TaxID=3064386 RepID=UPI00273FB5AD|nr:amino acid racemase [Microbulbifer sp. 2205BS26-8]MDP5210709.1 amino acid racemase [Microbulbifer sp. 2205BS26-8]
MKNRHYTKHVGIVGCSAEGAALCYKTICTESRKYLGEHAHPEISMHTHSLARYVKCLEANDLRGVGDLMLSSANKLKAQGADFLVCPDNTIHQAFDYVVQKSPLPWLHIGDCVVATAQTLGYKKPGILGTQWLVESDVYPAKLATAGLSWQRPPKKAIKTIGQLIMHELVYGIFKPETVRYFQDIIGDLEEAGCDSVILGCTEIPLIIDNSNSSIPTLNSNRLLAEAAIKEAIPVDRGIPSYHAN